MTTARRGEAGRVAIDGAQAGSTIATPADATSHPRRLPFDVELSRLCNGDHRDVRVVLRDPRPPLATRADPWGDPDFVRLHEEISGRRASP